MGAHNKIRDRLASTVMSSNSSTVVQTEKLLKADPEIIADVYVTLADEATGLVHKVCMDIVIINQSADSYAKQAAKQGNIATRIAEKKKRLHYLPITDEDEQTQLLPVAIEATGRMGEDITKFLKDMNKEHVDYKMKFQRMATVVTQHMWAKCVGRTRAIMTGEIPIPAEPTSEHRNCKMEREIAARMKELEEEMGIMDVNDESSSSESNNSSSSSSSSSNSRSSSSSSKSSSSVSNNNSSSSSSSGSSSNSRSSSSSSKSSSSGSKSSSKSGGMSGSKWSISSGSSSSSSNSGSSSSSSSSSSCSSGSTSNSSNSGGSSSNSNDATEEVRRITGRFPTYY